jgi:hypothetical protein
MLGNWFLLEHISDAKEESSLLSLRPLAVRNKAGQGNEASQKMGKTILTSEYCNKTQSLYERIAVAMREDF